MEKNKNKTQTKTKEKIKLDIPFELPQEKGKLATVSDKEKTKEKERTSKDSFKPHVRQGRPNLDFSRTDRDVLAKMAKGISDIDKKLKDLGIEKEEDLDIQQINRLAGITTSRGVEVKKTENLPAKIENLPKIINKELEEYQNMVVPKWTMVKDLPGYMKGSIRAFGREVMKVLAPGTPLEKIYVISSVGNLNTDKELNAVANYLKNHGIPDNEKSGKIIDLLPDYNPLVKVFRALGYTWLVVQDFAGKYIYVGEDPNPPMITKDKTKKIM
ncbi:MAG: hypothetical protein NZZ41_02040 [Candidatus Dojkabacteria bacterium]|nr:hypothetical protein [Candidatus Dojkabacteria bacterium]